MVTSVVAMSNFDDLPIAQTLAKMSLQQQQARPPPPPSEQNPENLAHQEHKEEDEDEDDATTQPESLIQNEQQQQQTQHPATMLKVGVELPPAGVPGRSILKSSEPSNNTADSTRTGRMSKKEVSFHSIQIRHYRMILGDNPACSIGAPVQLDWNHESEEKHDLDIYEVERRPRRKLRHLVLSYYRRKDILLQAGFDEGEMRVVEKQIGKLKRQRKTTGFFLPMQKMEEIAQSAGRKVRRVTGGKKKEDH